MNLRTTYYPGRTFQNDEYFQQSTLQKSGELFLPIPVSKNFLLIGGANYDRQQIFLNYKGNMTNDISLRLQQLYMQVGFIKTIHSRHKLMILAIPKFSEMSTKLDFQHKYFQLGGAVLYTYQRSKKLKYKWGLYYNREFFGNFFMPLLGIDWKINNRLYLFGVLPGSMNLEYKIRKRMYTGFSYRSITTSYGTELNYIREGDPFWGHNLLRNFINYYLSKNLVLGTELGCNAFREFQEYDKLHRKVNSNPLFQKTGSQFFFGINIAFKMRLDKEYD